MKEITGIRLIYNDSVTNISNFDLIKFSKITSAYEVIRIIENIPLFFEDHYIRLLQSINLLGIHVELNKEDILNPIKQLINENEIRNGNIKILVNNSETGRNIYCYFIKHIYPSELDYINGVNTLYYKAERINPNAKSVLLNLRQSVDKEKLLKKVYEVILVDKNDFVTEGSRSNIFFIKDDIIYTPPLYQVLGGITRKYVFEICERKNIKLIETKIEKNSLNNYSSGFISGTSSKILPIKNINGIDYNSNNHLLHIIIKEYDKEINKNLNSNKDLI
ncbi:aminotransferase class IV [Bacteroidota bacterium]